MRTTSLPYEEWLLTFDLEQIAWVASSISYSPYQPAYNAGIAADRDEYIIAKEYLSAGTMAELIITAMRRLAGDAAVPYTDRRDVINELRELVATKPYLHAVYRHAKELVDAVVQPMKDRWHRDFRQQLAIARDWFDHDQATLPAVEYEDYEDNFLALAPRAGMHRCTV